MLDEGIGGDEGVVFAGELLDQLLVFVELLQVICGHGIDTGVLGTIDIMLVSQDTITRRLVSSCSFISCSLPGRGLGDRSYQIFIPGRGTRGSLTVPEKRLSR